MDRRYIKLDDELVEIACMDAVNKMFAPISLVGDVNNLKNITVDLNTSINELGKLFAPIELVAEFNNYKEEVKATYAPIGVVDTVNELDTRLNDAINTLRNEITTGDNAINSKVEEYNESYKKKYAPIELVSTVNDLSVKEEQDVSRLLEEIEKLKVDVANLNTKLETLNIK